MRTSSRRRTKTSAARILDGSRSDGQARPQHRSARPCERGRPSSRRSPGRRGSSSRPVNLELMAEVEREAALEALAAFYDAIARPFQLVSVPAERDPDEHLAAMEERAEGRRIERAFAAYAALYREIAAAPRRPLRRTYLLLDAASEPELRRAMTSLARAAEERGVTAREVEPDGARRALGHASAGRDRSTASSPSVITRRAAATALVPSRRWPAEVEPGWLIGAARDRWRRRGLDAGPPARARRGDGVHDDPPAPGPGGRPAGRRAGRARRRRARAGRATRPPPRGGRSRPGRGRIYLVDTVLHGRGRGPREPPRADRGDPARGPGHSASSSTSRRSGSPTPGGRSCRVRHRGRSPSATSTQARSPRSLLHAASDLYEPTGHLYGRTRTSGAPIVLDRFAHASHNAIVLGQTGTGKTMFTGRRDEPLPHPRASGCSRWIRSATTGGSPTSSAGRTSTSAHPGVGHQPVRVHRCRDRRRAHRQDRGASPGSPPRWPAA